MVSTYISQNSAVYLARVITQAFFILGGGEMEAEQDKVIYLKLLLKRIKLELRVTVIQCNKVINLYSQLDVYSIPLRA